MKLHYEDFVLLISAEMEGSTDIDGPESPHNGKDLQVTPHLCRHRRDKQS